MVHALIGITRLTSNEVPHNQSQDGDPQATSNLLELPLRISRAEGTTSLTVSTIGGGRTQSPSPLTNPQSPNRLGDCNHQE
jgi:hypothetical protein